ncbi:MerR family transcriptional regulator [Desulforamulus aeronauticus]|uniref:Effector-binding domain-containing protein n=1 Tax=Desulforamulus aeronauticus DSM 10349 TaxID=1121421 RepID=A0A1M6TCJ6_9FIRM|nr:MerR family transcriptional regulator [Desulforamulus aeronauticus]SHK54762.1 effector-binding domain-containing protein [Desulforamulus aeronauticus DSM 10349]
MREKQTFSIGEIAKIHNIAESTLRYYDQIGIFQPKIVDPKSKYRYYTMDQFAQLDIIKFLRNMEIPLSEIKQYIHRRNPAIALELLEKQQQMVSRKQQELALVKEILDDKIAAIQTGLRAEPFTVSFKQLPSRTIASIELGAKTSDEMLDYYITSLQNDLLSLDYTLFTGDIGISIAQTALLQKNYQNYNRIFIVLRHSPEQNEHLTKLPAGMYACMYHRGPYEQTENTYEHLFEEIAIRGYKISGDALELGVIDLSVAQEESEYVTEMQIPVVTY